MCVRVRLVITANFFAILFFWYHTSGTALLKSVWGIIFSWGDFSLEGCGTLPQNSYKPSQDLYEVVKESHIGSAISEILRDRQTDKETQILLHLYKDFSLISLSLTL